MNEWVKKWIGRLLDEAVRDWKSGNCNMTDEEAMMLLDVLANIKVNKNQAADFVHLSQSQFDNEVAVGRIPEGKKLYRGDQHKYWIKRDLIEYIKRWRTTNK